MDKVLIKANGRELKKDSLAKLRKSGKIPAVLYGHKIVNQSLSIDLGEFEKAYKKAGDSTIVDLQTPDGKTHPVLIQDLQIHFLTSKPIHVDFYEVSMTEKLKAKIAIEFIGEAPVIKTSGGVLVKVMNEVEVECLPADLPHSIPVNLEALKTLQDAIHVKDLQVSPKVKILANPEEMVIKVQPPRDVETDLSAPVVEDVSKVEGAAEAKPENAEATSGAAKAAPAKGAAEAKA